MPEIYRDAWLRLASDRERCLEIERECTPVLAFGNWQTARIATAGLNPSEDEFQGRPDAIGVRAPLQGKSQRFLHWESGELSDERLAEAFRQMQGYFTLGNAYSLWFNRYRSFLDALQMPFESGLACHTDYVSPFATTTGISASSVATRRLLPGYGESVWLDVLSNCPHLRVVFGHGRGWRRVPALFVDFAGWRNVPTPFDTKGGKMAGAHLAHSTGRLRDGRVVDIYWWKPNRDGAPLCFLNADERAGVGHILNSRLAPEV